MSKKDLEKKMPPPPPSASMEEQVREWLYWWWSTYHDGWRGEIAPGLRVTREGDRWLLISEIEGTEAEIAESIAARLVGGYAAGPFFAPPEIARKLAIDLFTRAENGFREPERTLH